MKDGEYKEGDRLAWQGIRGTVYGTVLEVGGDLIVRVDGGDYLPLDDIIQSYSLTKL